MDVGPIWPILRERLRSLAHGDHVSFLCDGTEEQLAIAVECLLRGLLRGEQCLYVSDEAGLTLLRQSLLTDVSLKLDDERCVTGLMLMTHRQTPHGDRSSWSDTMMALLQQAVERTVSAGLPGLRVVIDMARILDAAATPSEIVKNEARLRDFFKKVPGIGLSLYDRRCVDPLRLEDALRPVVPVEGQDGSENPLSESLDIHFRRLDSRERFEWRLRRLCAQIREKGGSALRLPSDR